MLFAIHNLEIMDVKTLIFSGPLLRSLQGGEAQNLAPPPWEMEKSIPGSSFLFIDHFTLYWHQTLSSITDW